MDDNGDRKLLRAYAYSADGKVTGIKDYRNFQNGSTADYILRSYTYDSNDRVAKIVYVDSKAPDSVKESYAYTYDKNSNILTETIKNHSLATESRQTDITRTHTYDALGQLLTTTDVDAIRKVTTGTSYEYDTVGNRVNRQWKRNGGNGRDRLYL